MSLSSTTLLVEGGGVGWCKEVHDRWKSCKWAAGWVNRRRLPIIGDQLVDRIIKDRIGVQVSSMADAAVSSFGEPSARRRTSLLALHLEMRWHRENLLVTGSKEVENLAQFLRKARGKR